VIRIDGGEHPMDILFLVKPGFTDSARDGEGKKYYCPDCAFLEGVLGRCSELRAFAPVPVVKFSLLLAWSILRGRNLRKVPPKGIL